MISKLSFIRIRQAAFFIASIFWIICIIEYIDGNNSMSLVEWIVSIGVFISTFVYCRDKELEKAKWFKEAE